jgi:hypothetical protein
MSDSSLVEATQPRRPPFVRRLNPDGNERLTAATGLAIAGLAIAEIATLLLGLHSNLQAHVFIGLVLLPPIVVKLASTGWRFARYYSRNAEYREKGAPQLAMRLLAPLLVALTLLLFGSGVAMGLVHGEALRVARRIHGPASVLWMIVLGVHVLAYGIRALRAFGDDVQPRRRREASGARWRTYLVVSTLVLGLAIGLATLPVQHDWLHLGSHHHHHPGFDG